MSTPTRRTITRGAAWAVPSVAVGAAAPAVGASSTGTVTITRQTYYGIDASSCGSNGYKLTLAGDRTLNGTVYGATFKNTGSTVAIATNIYNVVWITVNNLKFTVNSGSANWSAPAATNLTQVIGGVTYYQYRSVYTGSVNLPANGSTYVPYSYSSSTCVTGTTTITAGQTFATVGTSAVQSSAGTAVTHCTYANGCS